MWLALVKAFILVCFDDRPHPDLLPRGEGTAMYASHYPVVRRANPVAGISRFKGLRRNPVGRNLILTSVGRARGQRLDEYGDLSMVRA